MLDIVPNKGPLYNYKSGVLTNPIKYEKTTMDSHQPDIIFQPKDYEELKIACENRCTG